MDNLDALKTVILRTPKLKSHFLSFVGEQIMTLGERSFDYTLEFYLKRFIFEEHSASKIWKICQNFTAEIISELTRQKDYPVMADFVKSIPKELDNRNGFTIEDGVIILMNYGRSKDLGINEKHKALLQKEKAHKQSENLLKKDLNGLLGITNLFKKEIKKKPKHEPHSVWTVKKK
jgi:hypothetical protein